jgi:predicted GNAT superfamily acetyltransferase
MGTRGQFDAGDEDHESEPTSLSDDEANIIVGACNLLDVIKGEWETEWSTWDQSIRDGLSEMLKKYYSVCEARRGKGKVER